MFGKEKKATPLEQAKQEIAALRAELAKQQGRTNAMLVERDFWVEQGRALQNQLQQWQRLYSGLFDQLGRGVVTDQTIADNLAMAAEELRQPVTTVEAVRALTASMQESTQGKYTSVGTRTSDKLIDHEIDGQRRLIRG